MQDNYIPYVHGVMNDIELDGVPTPGKPRRIPELEFEQVVPNDITAAVSMVCVHIRMSLEVHQRHQSWHVSFWKMTILQNYEWIQLSET